MQHRFIGVVAHAFPVRQDAFPVTRAEESPEGDGLLVLFPGDLIDLPDDHGLVTGLLVPVDGEPTRKKKTPDPAPVEVPATDPVQE